METDRNLRAYGIWVSVMYSEGILVKGIFENPIRKMAVGIDLSDALSNLEFSRADLNQIDYGDKFKIETQDITHLFPKGTIFVKPKRAS